jgi:aquaporin related protein
MSKNREKFLRLLILFSAEVIATSILMFIGCMGCVDKYENFSPNLASISAGFGFAVMLAINIFGCVSGAHMNPTITMAAWIYKLMDFTVRTFIFENHLI